MWLWKENSEKKLAWLWKRTGKVKGKHKNGAME